MKFWKKWPYWIKGGVLYLLIYYIVTILSFTIKSNIFYTVKGIIGAPIIFLSNMDFLKVVGIRVPDTVLSATIYLSILYFIVGAICGYIYGKTRCYKTFKLKK